MREAEYEGLDILRFSSALFSRALALVGARCYHIYSSQATIFYFSDTVHFSACNVPKSDMHANPKSEMHAKPKSEMHAKPKNDMHANRKMICMQTLKVRCMQTLKMTCMQTLKVRCMQPLKVACMTSKHYLMMHALN